MAILALVKLISEVFSRFILASNGLVAITLAGKLTEVLITESAN